MLAFFRGMQQLEGTTPKAVRYLSAHPAPGDLARLRELLGGARRPLVVAGGPGWTEAAAGALRAVAEASRLPVAASFRSHDVLDNRSPSYVGDLGVGIAIGAVRGCIDCVGKSSIAPLMSMFDGLIAP